MQFLYPALLLALVVGPILLAWFKGDQILDRLATTRQHQKQRRRRRTTNALPVREDVIKTLLGVESRRDHIDDAIGGALAAFREISATFHIVTAQHATASAIDEMEQILLSRESQFNTYLDIACLQSETIDLFTREIDLLKQLAKIPAEIPVSPSAPTPGERLLQNLEQAQKKRAQIDSKLNGLGSQAKSSPTTGTRFDTTLE